MNIELNEKEMKIIINALNSKICDKKEAIRKVNRAPFQYIDSHRVPEWKEEISIMENILDRLGRWVFGLLDWRSKYESS